VAVSLSLSTEHASLPIAWRLYLPEVWAKDGKRRKKTGGTGRDSISDQGGDCTGTNPHRSKREIPVGVVLAAAAYGTDTKFREALTDLGLFYVVGIMSSVIVWRPGQGPLPAATWKGQGRPPKYLRRNPRHAPVTVKTLPRELPPPAWKKVGWRQGTRHLLQSRFAACARSSGSPRFRT